MKFEGDKIQPVTSINPTKCLGRDTMSFIIFK